MIDFNIHRLASLVNQLAEQRQFDGRLVKQISCLEENVTNCQVALEELQHMMEKLRKCVFIFIPVCMIKIIMSPHFCGRHIVFALSVRQSKEFML
jgi:hypothetical protein